MFFTVTRWLPPSTVVLVICGVIGTPASVGSAENPPAGSAALVEAKHGASGRLTQTAADVNNRHVSAGRRWFDNGSTLWLDNVLNDGPIFLEPVGT